MIDIWRFLRGLGEEIYKGEAWYKAAENGINKLGLAIGASKGRAFAKRWFRLKLKGVEKKYFSRQNEVGSRNVII